MSATVRSVFRAMLPAIVVIGFVLPVGAVRALPYCADSETITIGTVDSGSYSNLCACDGTAEVLREASDSGVSKLRAKWTFSNVAPGTISLHFKGTRPSNSEGDNFQFYYTTTGSPFGVLIPGAIINKAFAPAEGVTIELETTTTTKTFTVFLSDTSSSGSALDTVSLDCVQIDDGVND